MEKKKYTYDLTFEEVLKEMWNRECWYQGEKFADGVIILANADNNGILQDFYGGCLNTSLLVLNAGLCNQKYRRVYTQPDAERRV